MNTSQVGLIALGANLPSCVGAPVETIRHAMVDIANLCTDVIGESALFMTPCFPAGAGPDYANAAMAVKWSETAKALLEHLHQIEASYARTRESRWAARPLDLDLVALGDQVAPSFEIWRHWHDLPLVEQKRRTPAELILPHPRLQDRAFVLVPLAEVAADWRHPILERTISELLTACPLEDVREVKPL